MICRSTMKREAPSTIADSWISYGICRIAAAKYPDRDREVECGVRDNQDGVGVHQPELSRMMKIGITATIGGNM